MSSINTRSDFIIMLALLIWGTLNGIAKSHLLGEDSAKRVKKKSNMIP